MPTRRRRLIFAALCLLHLMAVGTSASWYAIGLDEPAMVAGGLWTLTTARHDLYPHTPPLTKILVAAPYYFSGAELPPHPFAKQQHRPEWSLGYHVMQQTGWNRKLLLASRCTLLIFSLVTLAVIWSWTRQVAGTRAAVLATASWSLYPPAITWGAIATADSAVTCMYLLGCFTIYRLCRDPSPATGWWAGMAVGIGLLVKSTLLVMLLFAPAACAAAVGWRRLRKQNTNVQRTFIGLGMFYLIALAVLWCGYLGDGAGQRHDAVAYQSRTLPKAIADYVDVRSVERFTAPIPLMVPRSFLQGLLNQMADFEANRNAYFAGHRSSQGWWWWYAAVYALKTPIGYYALLLVACLRYLAHPAALQRVIRGMAFLSMASLLYLAIVSRIGFSIYWRYALGFVPPLIMAVSIVCLYSPCGGRSARRFAAVCGGCLLLVFVEVVSSLPNLHGNFNLAARLIGPADFWIRGHALDYGQERHRPSQWLQRHPLKQPCYVSQDRYLGDVRNPYFPDDAKAIDIRDSAFQQDAPPTGWYVMPLADKAWQEWVKNYARNDTFEELGSCYRIIHVASD